MEKKRLNIFFWYMGLMGKRLPVYLAAVFFSTIGQSGSKVAESYLVKNIVTAAQTKEADGLLTSVLLNFLIIVFMLLFWRFNIIRYNIEARYGVARVEKMVFSKAMRLPMSYYEQNHSGDFMSRLIFDTERAGDIYTSRFRRLVSSIISAVVFLIPMFYFSAEITWCLLGVSLVSFLVNSRFTGPMKRAGKEASRQNAVMTEKLTNILAGIEVVKIFSAGKGLLRSFRDANGDYSRVQLKTGKLSASLESLNCMFDLTGALAFLGVGIYFVSHQKITLGELTAVYTLYGSFRYVFLDIGRYLPQMMNCVANAEQVYLFLEREEEKEYYPCAGGPPQEDTAVSVEDLTFSYGSKKVLDHFSLQIKKGSCVAITGESGCGKSTLAKLLLGFYQPQEGTVSINGKNYGEITLDEIRSQIAYVPQEPYLYEVSIAENIAYGKEGADPGEVSMEEIVNAAKAANAHDFIMKLPEGYDTVPGERGNKLSGGEKQRIAIARAVIKNAPILLLDEATSALDNESERLINEALNRICRDRTTIMIAHRSSTIAMADTVVQVCQAGKR